MSYRLINANALAANCKQVNDMPCIYADLPNGLDGGYYDLARGNSDKSRWFQLFGTPERVARTLRKNGKSIPACFKCLVRDECASLPEDNDCPMDDYDALFEWLRGDAE